MDDLHWELPAAIRATSPQEVKLVALVRWEAKVVGEYQFQKTGNRRLAVRYDCEVEVIDRPSGRSASTKIQGDDPPYHARESQTTARKPMNKLFDFLESLKSRP